MADRLSGRETEVGFLDQLPLYLAARLAEVTGACILFGKQVVLGGLSLEDRLNAGTAGFAVAQACLGEFLAEFYSEWVTSNTKGAKGVGGTFMKWLQDSRKNPDYEFLRGWVRDQAVEYLPLGPGDEFLGKVSHRRLHSVYTAADEYQVHPKRLRKLLRQANIIGPETDGLHDSRAIFRVEAVHDLITASINGEQGREYLGMNRVQWEQVRKANLLETLFGESDETQTAYSKAGLDRFLESVSYQSGDVEGLVPIARALKLAGCGYVDVIVLLQQRSLERVSTDPSKRGFSAILVAADEVKQKVAKPALPGLTAKQVAKQMGLVINAVYALTAHGDLPSERMQSYGGTREARFVRQEAVLAFLREYMPLSELAAYLGVQRSHHACRLMDEAGVAPVFTSETRRAVIYRRSEVYAGLQAQAPT
ncbi:hypothetical protein [Aminobacter ciceronei]|uniref:Uncharacterized protein n=1 Tax=Aminobacter ciceronei TaxID=150723 RepID=A0ABR6CHX2_9HYPH|nr:hypothetical protein [Aminobacter ciceronei]MBA8910535.1 hypothetical protein [Aminobacter ciceronei]MBA9024306.1 hypothetical protein [Aminobacter ciceronei]